MPELVALGHRFDSRMRDIRGRSFIGRFVAVPEGNPTQIVPAKRLLRVPPSSFLKPGDIVVDHAGKPYLLAEGPGGFARNETINKTFRAVTADWRSTWTRTIKAIDPVTKVERDSVSIDLGMIYFHLEPKEERLERSFRVTGSYEKWKLYTNVDLQIDDVVDGRLTVVRAEWQAGVRVADVA